MPKTEPYARVAERAVPGGRLLRHWTLTGGVSAKVEALEILTPDGELRRLVVRQPQASVSKPDPAATCAMEHWLLSTLHRHGVRVPASLLVDASAKILRKPYRVMELVDGTTELPAETLDLTLPRMATWLADLHALDFEPLGLTELPPREDPIAGALHFLPSTREHAAARAGLADWGPLRGARALLHGDFWPGNILWRDGEIVAVVDWEDAAIGDPLCDLATARLELTWKHGPAAAETFTELYVARTEPVHAELAVWELFVASAAAEFLGRWGLPRDVQARMRERTHQLIAEATERLLDRRPPARRAG